MKSAQSCMIVLVTAPDLKLARLLVRLALESRLVACGNIVPKIESHYWWQGKIVKGSEVLILFKTSAKALDQLEKLVLEHHPYDTPEVLALSLHKGSPRYLTWIEDSLRGPKRQA
ncbi:MAG: divalent-cation tolerance protein CutA [Verrucomicrobiia bacterium]